MKKYISFLALIVLLFSCENVKKETSLDDSNTPKKEIAADYKNIEVTIEGMTCEIGCARTIESKLSKVNGVSFSKVDFESKKGTFTYDNNKISEEDIIDKISGIAGGELYKATKIKTIE